MSEVFDKSEWRRVPPSLRRHTSEPLRILILSDFELWPEEVAWLTIEDFNLKLNRT